MIVESKIKDKFTVIYPFRKEFFKGIKKEISQASSVKGTGLGRRMYALHKNSDGGVFVEALFTEVLEKGDEELGDFLLSTWVMKQADLFQYFHQKLSSLNADYEQLIGIPQDLEQEMKKEILAEFTALEAYLFSILNSVVFSKEVLQEFLDLAHIECKGQEVHSVSIEELQKSFAVERQKCMEKQERRILGMAERHKKEVEGYRKQIAQLQKRLEEGRA